MVTIQQILQEAKYIISGKTIEETAKHFKCGVRTIQLHMNVKLYELSKMDSQYKVIYDQVIIKKAETAKEKMILGGSIGAKKPTWTTLEAEEIARHMMQCNLTIRQAATNLGLYDEKYNDIPKSTLYDRLMNGINDTVLLNDFTCFLESHKSNSPKARK